MIWHLTWLGPVLALGYFLIGLHILWVLPTVVALAVGVYAWFPIGTTMTIPAEKAPYGLRAYLRKPSLLRFIMAKSALTIRNIVNFARSVEATLFHVLHELAHNKQRLAIGTPQFEWRYLTSPAERARLERDADKLAIQTIELQDEDYRRAEVICANLYFRLHYAWPSDDLYRRWRSARLAGTNG